MPRVTPVLSKARKAVQDLDLVKVLQSEISHELASNRFQNGGGGGSMGDFVVESDAPRTQDVVLRKNCEPGEEVAVSALLGPIAFGKEGVFPRQVLMKVCVKKAGLSSLLQFDCEVLEKDHNGSRFEIHNAYYLRSATSLGTSVYRGPKFSTLDPQLQDELKRYLVSKGIGETLTNFLLLHLHKKEQGQYVDWLHKIQSSIEKVVLKLIPVEKGDSPKHHDGYEPLTSGPKLA